MNLRDKRVLVADHGLYISLATRLAREFDEVMYAPIYSQGFPTYHTPDVGKDVPGITHVADFWKAVPEADLIVFPDIFEGSLQTYLRRQGKRVWGSGRGDELEIYRHYFKRVLEAVDLPVQPYQVLTGMAALREYLKKHDDKFVKMSCKLRGIMETWHHVTYWQSEARLDDLQHKLGLKQYETVFVVEAEIPTKIEVGGDTYCIDGEYPSIVTNGIEIKDKCSASVVQRYDDLPDEVQLVLERIAPVLKRYNYRNFFSTEIRIAKDGTPYFIDPTCRQPSPVGECEHELYANLGEVMWNGAEGKLIDPKPAAKYAVEAIICAERATEDWTPITFPESIRQWVKLYFHRQVNGHDFVIPQSVHMREVGAVVGIGNTLKEAEENCKKNAEQVKGDSVHIHLDAIPQASEEFDIMAKKGMNIEPIT